MLRLVIVLLLLAANGLMLAWQQGWLGGVAPAQQDREPERLKRQVNPDALRVLPPLAASAALAEAVKSNAAASATVDGAPPAASGASSAAASGADAPRAASGVLTGAAPSPVVAGLRRIASGLVTQAPSVAVAAPLLCLEAGPFAVGELPNAEKALRAAALPPGSWTVVKSERQGSYMIYMGRYADQATLERKQAQLQRLKVEAKPMVNWPELQPGLVLGRFDDKAAADEALAGLSKRGVRTSRVVTLSPSVTLATLRVPAADAPLREQLAAVKLPIAGMAFGPCGGETRKA
ncbi:MAG: hypothetical protein IPP44_29360 [Ideonella sp.]|nr:hypothetical protein [Ideonella sp.]